MKVSTDEQVYLIEQLKTEFEKQYGSSSDAVYSVTPASLVLLGDHTQYNDGLMIAASINSFVGIALRKTNKETVSLVYNGIEFHHKKLLDIILETEDNVSQSLTALLRKIEKENLLGSGFECLILNWSPKIFGLGNSAALTVGLMKAFETAFGLNLNQKDIVDFCSSSDKEIFGELVNKSLYYSSLAQRKNTLMYFDTRTEHRKYFPLNTNFTLVICNTNKQKENFREICKERIEECNIGAKGLRLYIWGVKNLRDVEETFLQRHVNMIPRRLFVRCLYNVKARKIVENAYKYLRDRDFKKFGAQMFETHIALLNDYEICSDECSCLVNSARETGLAEGYKMMSCSYYDASINLVRKSKTKEFASAVKRNYFSRSGKNLEVIEYKLSEGVTVRKNKEFVKEEV